MTKRQPKGERSPSLVMPFRLPADLVRRLDALAERLSEERPGIEITRSDVVRMLLLRGVDEEERRHDR